MTSNCQPELFFVFVLFFGFKKQSNSNSEMEKKNVVILLELADQILLKGLY